MSSSDPFDNAATMDSEAPPVAKKSRRGCLIGCGIVSGIFLLVCCGGGYWGYKFVTEQFGLLVKDQVAGNPVIQEQLGDVESVTFDFRATSTETQKANEQGNPGVLVFNVEGSKANGQLLVDQGPGNEPDFDSMTLVTEDGTRIPINAVDELENEMLEDIDMDDIDLPEIDTGDVDALGVESTDSGTNTENPEPDTPNADENN
ncbi:MAG: hypothetical protein AAGG48_12135 [Planctomycetota bacterium]